MRRGHSTAWAEWTLDLLGGVDTQQPSLVGAGAARHTRRRRSSRETEIPRETEGHTETQRDIDTETQRHRGTGASGQQASPDTQAGAEGATECALTAAPPTPSKRDVFCERWYSCIAPNACVRRVSHDQGKSHISPQASVRAGPSEQGLPCETHAVGVKHEREQGKPRSERPALTLAGGENSRDRLSHV
jgi:hypothetical protein